MSEYLVDPKGREPGWYIVCREKKVVYRGPFKHEETAGAVREEMERFRDNATWNLWCVFVTEEQVREANAEPHP